MTESPSNGIDSLLDREREKLIVQYIKLIKRGKDPSLNSTRCDSPEFETLNAELLSCEVAMAMMQAEFACVDAAARAMDMRSTPTPSSFIFSHPGRHNAAVTIQWLKAHYEEKEGISLPRGAMFGHYLDYCQQTKLDPVNQATFGKIIRMVFPDVKTRRLGTRGQSKYHYYGLTIKDTSPYKDIMLNAQRVNNYLGEPSGKGMYSRTVAQSSMTSSPCRSDDILQGSVLLQDFPSASTVTFPDDKKDTVAVFLMMYRHHSQRVLDTVLRANFSEVKEFVIHFWQSLPNHIQNILGNEKLIQTIALCDAVLYKAIVSLLIPGLLQPLASSLMMAIRTFGRDLVAWLSDALKNHPSELKLRKIQVARRFGRSLWRQTALSHMSSVARSFLHSGDLMRKLCQDWSNLDLDVIVKDIARDLDLKSGIRHRLQCTMENFADLLQHQTSLDKYMSWVKVVYIKAVKDKYQCTSGLGLQGASRLILLQWAYVTKVVIRELTLLSADMFGPYHLLGLLFQDYTMFVSEEWQREEAEHHIKTFVYEDNAKVYVPDWEKDMSTERETSKTDYNPAKYLSPEKGYKSGSQYHVLAPNHSRRGGTSFTPEDNQDYHSASNYANIPSVHGVGGQCNLVGCHDDMVRQHRAFDGDIDRTSPDDISSRALDLSINFNSSLTDDDALVDKVISKGYATLDDCSHVLGPQTWKHESTSTPVPTSSPLTQSPPELLDGRMRFPIFSPLIQQQGYNSSIPDPQYTTSEPLYANPSRTTIRDYMGSQYSPAIYINSPSNSSNISANPQYSKQIPTSSYTKGNSSYSNLTCSSAKEGLSESPATSCETSPDLHGTRFQTTDSPIHQFRGGSYPFTHISGSLQMAPMNPRKKWMMEEEIRSGLLQSSSSRIQPT